MRHEITIAAIAHRDMHRLAAVLKGTPDVKYRKDGGVSVVIAPDFIDITFVRTPGMLTWECDEVEIGGPIVLHNSKGKRSLHVDRRGSHIYGGVHLMPSWLQSVFSVLAQDLPE